MEYLATLMGSSFAKEWASEGTADNVSLSCAQPDIQNRAITAMASTARGKTDTAQSEGGLKLAEDFGKIKSLF